MVQDLSQLTTPATPGDPDKADNSTPRQAIAGLTPPQLGEAMIRETWPTVVDAQPALSALGQKLIRTVVLAPLGWLLLAPLYFKKILPFLARRYTLTNRRVMVRRGLKPHPVQEVALADIDDVRVPEGSYDPFWQSGTVEVVSKGKVVLTLAGVPEPEGFRLAVVNACAAWVPGKAKTFGAFVAAGATK